MSRLSASNRRHAIARKPWPLASSTICAWNAALWWTMNACETRAWVTRRMSADSQPPWVEKPMWTARPPPGSGGLSGRSPEADPDASFPFPAVIATMMARMADWLMKSEPDVFGIETLRKKKREHWDGVRNYQARNHMKKMALGDRVLFYHSSVDPPG